MSQRNVVGRLMDRVEISPAKEKFEVGNRLKTASYLIETSAYLACSKRENWEFSPSMIWYLMYVKISGSVSASNTFLFSNNIMKELVTSSRTTEMVSKWERIQQSYFLLKYTMQRFVRKLLTKIVQKHLGNSWKRKRHSGRLMWLAPQIFDAAFGWGLDQTASRQ